jgi:hypothetical protein
MRTTSSGPQRSGGSFPRSDTAPLLLDLEELLIEQLAGGASYGQRLEIEAQLSEVRRELARLGFAPSK